MADTRQLCSVFLGDLCLGIEVLEVQEVIRSQPLTPVPLAPSAVAGLINLRGQIVTAVDLRRRFGLPERAAGAEPMNVVVRTEGGAVSLLVDEIGDVIEPPADAFEQAPETLAPAARSLVRGVYKLPGRLMLALDTARAVDLDQAPETPRAFPTR